MQKSLSSLQSDQAAKEMSTEWSVRERLILASSVLNSGDQNWVSVSRAVKPLLEQTRPSEDFSQKNCAIQYSEMLEKVGTSKRKRSTDMGMGGETPGEQIVRKLTYERIDELKKSIKAQHALYKKLKQEVKLIAEGKMEDSLEQMWQEIQAEKAAAAEKDGETQRIETEPTATEKIVVGERTTSDSSSSEKKNDESGSVLTAEKELGAIEKDAQEKVVAVDVERNEDPKKGTSDEETEMVEVETVEEEKKTDVEETGAREEKQDDETPMEVDEKVDVESVKTREDLDEKNAPGIDDVEMGEKKKEEEEREEKNEAAVERAEAINNAKEDEEQETDKDNKHEPQPQSEEKEEEKDEKEDVEVKDVNIEAKATTDKSEDELKSENGDDNETKCDKVDDNNDDDCQKDDIEPVDASKVEITESKVKEAAPAESDEKQEEEKVEMDEEDDKEDKILSVESQRKSEEPTAVSPPAQEKEEPLKEEKTTEKDDEEEEKKEEIEEEEEEEDEKEGANDDNSMPDESSDIPAEPSLPVKSVSPTSHRSSKMRYLVPVISPIKSPEATKAPVTSEAVPVKEEKREEDSAAAGTKEIKSSVDEIVSPAAPPPTVTPARGGRGKASRRRSSEREVGYGSVERKAVVTRSGRKIKASAKASGMYGTTVRSYRSRRRSQRESEEKAEEVETATTSKREDPNEEEDEEDEEEGDDEQGKDGGEGDGNAEDEEVDVKDSDVESPLVEVEKRDVADEASPRVTSAGSSTPSSPPIGDFDQKAWRKTIMVVWKKIAEHRNANLFLRSVSEKEAPGYHDVVRRPMDLATIKNRVDKGLIKTTEDFQRDVLLMFQNALMYNGSDHDVYQMTQEMRSDYVEFMDSHLSLQLKWTQRSAKDEFASVISVRQGSGGGEETELGSRRGSRHDVTADQPPAKKRKTRGDDS